MGKDVLFSFSQTVSKLTVTLAYALGRFPKYMDILITYRRTYEAIPEGVLRVNPVFGDKPSA